MKQIVVHKQFLKQFRKLPHETQTAFQKRRNLFLLDEQDHLLNVHNLVGKYKGLKSFNVNADIRVIYREIDTGSFLFVAIGTHSELYS